MKKWMSLSIIIILLIIIALGILLPSNLKGKIQGKIIAEKYPEETKINYSIIQENQLNPELSNYVSLIYECEDFNNQIRCTGEVKYLGPENYKTQDMYVRLYCYTEKTYEITETKEECTLDNDYLYLGSMNTERNNLNYQLKCFYGDYKNIGVKIGISEGVIVYPYRC